MLNKQEKITLISDMFTALQNARESLRHLKQMILEAERHLLRMEGEQIGKLTVVKTIGISKIEGHDYLWSSNYLCVCECGNEVQLNATEILNQTSCGECDNE